MPSFKLYLDHRQESKSGLYPVKILVSHNGKSILISTGVKAPLQHWSNVAQRISKKWSGANNANSKLIDYMAKCDRLFFDVDTSNMDISKIKTIIQQKVFNKSHRSPDLFLPVLQRHIDEAEGTGTIKNYNHLKSMLSEYCDIDTLTFSDVDYKWLIEFISHLTSSGVGKNSVKAYVNRMKTIFNRAIRDDVTTLYPFDKLRLKGEETRKRNISVEELRSLMNMNDLTPPQSVSRDIFLLSFFLIGMNYTDMRNGHAIVRNGRVQYKRAKTGKLYDIKIEPEFQRLVDKYTTKGAIKIPMTIENVNVRLKSLIPGLSTYYARHTWATIAIKIGIPIETVSLALGHTIGSPITNIYIEYDLNKVDEANRQVLDYVLHSPRSTPQ